MKSLRISSVCVALALAGTAHAQVQLQLGDVTDQRSTGDPIFSRFEVKVKVTGDELKDAQSMRGVVKTAVDDIGEDLTLPGGPGEFHNIHQPWPVSEITLKLKNPARKVESIKELSGEVQFFVPKNDPGATLTVDEFQKAGGKPIESPVLKEAGIVFTTFNKEQTEATNKEEAAGASKPAGDGNKEKPDLKQVLTQAFGHMLMGGGPNAITVRIHDPNNKLAGFEFQDAGGKKIQDSGTSWNPDDPGTKVYNFQSKLPETTRLVIYVLTPKSLVTTPLSLKDIHLP